MENKLPLVSYVSELYPELNLANTVLIACQHLLGTTLDLFAAFFSKGLKPENVYLIGKCYSTNNEVYDEFVKSGVNVAASSKSFDSYCSFDEQFKGNIENFLQNIKHNNIQANKQILLLDDGAQLLLSANRYFKDFKNIFGVEQTSSGFEKLKNVKLRYPVVNVARSKAKLKIESPMIAELAVRRILKYFEQEKIFPVNIMVVGQGSIGKNICELLRTKFKVRRYDLITHGHPFPGRYKERLDRFDVIIGATGQPIIYEEDFAKLRKNVILASVSSSDREFSAVTLRKDLSQNNDCHRDISIRNVNLLNSGFPITFHGNKYEVAPHKIQLTMALLAAGVFQTLSLHRKKGLIDLDVEVQRNIIKKFKSLN